MVTSTKKKQQNQQSLSLDEVQPGYILFYIVGDLGVTSKKPLPNLTTNFKTPSLMSFEWFIE